jgi:tetratricopeptide (TPR) repeat protein
MIATAALVAAILAGGSAVAQVPPSERPWDTAFRASWSAQAHGQVAQARELTAKGWDLVKRAGPLAPGYSDGVELAYATSIAVSGPLRAQEFYTEALHATEPPALAAVRLQILLRMAVRFETHQEVQARRRYAEAVDLAGRTFPRPACFAQILTKFADLQDKMGEPEEAGKLRHRAVTEPGTMSLPTPIYGLADDPNDAPFHDLAPEIRRIVGEAYRLILGGEFDRARAEVDKGFILASGFPAITRYRESLYFQILASAYSRQKRFADASETLRRDLVLAERAWGPDHPRMADALISATWTYINELRDNKSASELAERAADVVRATSGEASDAMRQVEDVRLRLAQLEGNQGAIADHKAKLEQLWAEVHGAKTKPLVIQ